MSNTRRAGSEGVSGSTVDQKYAALGAANTFAMIERSKQGVKNKLLEAVQLGSPFTEAEWAVLLDMSPRTLQRHKQQTDPLDRSRSERVLLIEQMLRYGQEIFGDKESFAMWLRASNWPLNGKRPIELLDTATGIQLVYAALVRIDHGVYV